MKDSGKKINTFDIYIEFMNRKILSVENESLRVVFWDGEWAMNSTNFTLETYILHLHIKAIY